MIAHMGHFDGCYRENDIMRAAYVVDGRELLVAAMMATDGDRAVSVM